jgi:hypothetical protein
MFPEIICGETLPGGYLENQERREDNIRMDCRESDYEDVKWTELAQVHVHVLSCSGFCC